MLVHFFFVTSVLGLIISNQRLFSYPLFLHIIYTRLFIRHGIFFIFLYLFLLWICHRLEIVYVGVINIFGFDDKMKHFSALIVCELQVNLSVFSFIEFQTFFFLCFIPSFLLGFVKLHQLFYDVVNIFYQYRVSVICCSCF